MEEDGHIWFVKARGLGVIMVEFLTHCDCSLATLGGTGWTAFELHFAFEIGAVVSKERSWTNENEFQRFEFGEEMEEFFEKDEVLCFPSRGSDEVDFEFFSCGEVGDTLFQSGDYGEGEGHCVCCYKEEHGDSFH